MFRYRAYELIVLSELAFPELISCSESDIVDSDCVTIQLGKLNPNGLDSPLLTGLLYQMTETALWLNVPGIARFLVRDGNHVTVDPVPGLDEASIRLFVLDACMSMLLIKRRLLLFHGSVVQLGQHCVAFTGGPGSGKSTIAAAFLRRGYSVLSDAICAVDERWHVMPGYPQIRLWFDAAKRLGFDTRALQQIRPELFKFYVPLSSQFHASRLPLKVVYVLETHNRDEIALTHVEGMGKLRPLLSNTYEGPKQLQRCTQLASQVSVVNVAWPYHVHQLDKLVDLIENDFACHGLKNAIS